MKKAEKKLDILKSLIIVLLFVFTLIMVYLQLDTLRKSNAGASGVSDLESDFGIRENGLLGSNSLSEYILLPASVAVKSGDETYAISAGSDFMHDVYSQLSHDLSFVFSNSCIASASANEKDFDKALEEDEFIYLRYHSSLPAVIIYMHAIGDGYHENESAIGAQTGSVYVNEMILFTGKTENGDVYALTRALSGETMAFTVERASEDILSHTEDFEIYKSASAMTKADFYGTEENSSLLPTTLIYNQGMSYYKLSAEKGFEGLSENKEVQSSVANLFGINTDKTGSYFDTELEGTVYMATHGTLTVTNTGVIYSTENNASGGVALSDYTGNDENTAHTVKECLAVAELLGNELWSVLSAYPEIQSEAELLITGLRREGDTLILEYGFFYDNIPISGFEKSLIIELTSYKVTGLEITPAMVTVHKTEQQRCIYPDWIANIAASVSGGESCTLVYKYFLSENGSFDAEWVPVKIKK